jgi:excisionase family DNA binding protein
MPTLTVAEAAASLGISQQRVRKLIADGRVTARRIGKRVLVIDSRALEAILVRNGRPGRPKKLLK